MIKYFTIEDLLKHYLQKKFHILVTDRFIQQAIAQVLTPIYEEQFRPSGLKYLGFGFCFDTRAHQFKAKSHAKSVVKFKRRMKVLTCRRD